MKILRDMLLIIIGLIIGYFLVMLIDTVFAYKSYDYSTENKKALELIQELKNRTIYGMNCSRESASRDCQLIALQADLLRAEEDYIAYTKAKFGTMLKDFPLILPTYLKDLFKTETVIREVEKVIVKEPSQAELDKLVKDKINNLLNNL